jgi:hypothetical protein
VRYTKNQIVKALQTVQGLLKGPVRPAARIAEVLSPYMDCTEVGGVDGQLQVDIRSSIFARMGDAYRREGNAQLAAQWYRRASAISPGDHAVTYAHTVCKHELADFYSDALATLEEHRRRWLAKPIMVRFMRRIVPRKWTDPEGREIVSSEKRNLEFLRQRAFKKAA